MTVRTASNLPPTKLSLNWTRALHASKLTCVSHRSKEEKWSGFESAVHDINKKRADHQVAPRAERREQKGPVDFIEQMRQAAVSMSERSVAEKQLADAAQPVYAVLTISRRSASRMS